MADLFTCLIAALLQPALLFQQDVRFYKIGVGLINLVEEQYEQPDLLNLNPNNPKLMNVYDTAWERHCVFNGTRDISEVVNAASDDNAAIYDPQSRFTEDQVLAISQSTILCQDIPVY